LEPVSILPFCATKRLDKQSGTLLPKATSERPITVSGIINVYPIMVTIHTRIYEVIPIQTIQTTNEKYTYFWHDSFFTSGMVK